MQSRTIVLDDSIERLVVVSDLHSYREPLEVLDARLARFSDRFQVFVNGDLFEGGIDPVETIEWVRKYAPAHTTQGNHDSHLSEHDPEQLTEKRSLDTEMGSYPQLNSKQLQFVRRLPEQLLVHWRGKAIRILHGHHNPINSDYTHWQSTPEHLMGLFHDTSFDLTLVGHTHFPFVLEHANSILANSGSVSIPVYSFRTADGEIKFRVAADGSLHKHNGCSFLSVTSQAGQLNVQIVKFDYDRHPLLERYAQCQGLKLTLPFRKVWLRIPI